MSEDSTARRTWIGALFAPDASTVDALDRAITAIDMSAVHGGDRNQSFQAGCLLLSHIRPDLVQAGRVVMEGLISRLQQSADCNAPEVRVLLRDSKFYLAVGLAKQNELARAQAVLQDVLVVDPANHQALALKEHLDRELMMLGVKGLAGTVAACAAAFAFYKLLRR